MRKKILSLLCFWIGFSIVLTIVCIPFQPLKKLGDQYLDVIERTQNLACEKENTMDAVVLGDSIPWAGISPLRMYAQDKITVYNCSTSGQRVMDSIAILQRTLRYQKPQAVVLDVNSVFTRIRPIKNSLEVFFPVFKYHDYYMKDFEKGGSLDDWKGYTYADTIVPFDSGEYMIHSDVKLGKINRRLMDKLYSICQKNSISLVLMALPCPNSWNQTKHDLIQKWADTHKVKFLDLNSNGMVNVDSATDFRDYGEHLNDMGATKCSYALGKYLKETYNLQEKTNQEYERAIEAVGVYGQDGLQ